MMICPFHSTILQNTVKILQDTTYKVRPKDEAVPKLFQGLFIGEIFGTLVRMNDGEYHRVLKLAVSQALNHFEEQYIQEQTKQVIQDSKIIIDSPETLTQAIQILPIKNTRRFLENEIAILPLQDDEEGLPFGVGVHCCPGKVWAKTITETIIKYLKQSQIEEEWLHNYEWKTSMNANVPLFISKGEIE